MRRGPKAMILNLVTPKRGDATHLFVSYVQALVSCVGNRLLKLRLLPTDPTPGPVEHVPGGWIIEATCKICTDTVCPDRRRWGADG